MTIEDVLSNEELRRREFPVTQSKVFLAHAGVCPLPRRVADSISRCALDSATGDQESIFFPAAIHDSRELASRLLNCESDEVALVGPTSLGLSHVAAGLDFTAGDNVVIYFDDYPSNVYPWLALQARGVEVRRVLTSELGLIQPENVLAKVDQRTRLVALASCHFIAGLRPAVEEIGIELRKRDVLFCVDGIQTVGAFPLDLEHVDFLAADAHKWMLGPCAAGLLYVRKEVQSQLRPAAYGWHNVRCPDFVSQKEIVLRAGAKRYEAGTHNLLGIVGMNAAMELLLEIGIENIARELLRKRQMLVPELRNKGWEVLHADANDKTGSGIVSFFSSDKDVMGIHTRLTQHNIVTSIRMDRQERRFIRLSPHFYNTDEELRRVLELV